jgi:hypothetical protein
MAHGGRRARGDRTPRDSDRRIRRKPSGRSSEKGTKCFRRSARRPRDWWNSRLCSRGCVPRKSAHDAFARGRARPPGRFLRSATGASRLSAVWRYFDGESRDSRETSTFRCSRIRPRGRVHRAIFRVRISRENFGRRRAELARSRAGLMQAHRLRRIDLHLDLDAKGRLLCVRTWIQQQKACERNDNLAWTGACHESHEYRPQMYTT